MQPIEFDDYDKISDDMMYLGNNISLRFNVLLSRKASMTDNTRRFFHSEFRHKSKFMDADSAISIKRSFSYYISIDVGGERWDSSIMIRIQDILILRDLLKQVTKWLMDGKTFEVIDGNLICHKRKSIKLDNMPDGKYILFDPIVLEYNSVQRTGIRMSLSSNDVYVDMNTDAFFGFKYLIDTVDMFSCAQNMLNYIGRPDYGYNLTNFDNDYRETVRTSNSPIKAEYGRPIPGKPSQISGVKKNKSFFDK